MTFRIGPPTVPNPSPHVPAGLIEAFADEFESLSIESGSLPTTGATWGDSFIQFGVRNLAANNDECIKGRPEYANGAGPTLESIGCHTMQQAGSSLVMGGYEIPVPNRPDFFNFPYAGPHLDGRRSCNFSYGYIEWRIRFVSMGPGTHWSLWLWSSTRNDYEVDILEVIGSNTGLPNGPVVPNHFHNTIDNSPGGIGHGFTNIATTSADMFDWHVWGVEITPTTMTWNKDGVVVRTHDNTFDSGTIWHPFTTLEMGAGGTPTGSFPGAVNGSTPLPTWAELDYIRVYTTDGTLEAEQPLP
ncbi:MAG: glycoside hydrolase family 16 protein [Geminicoccaceae bacterium]